jgi:hypothetical protein
MKTQAAQTTLLGHPKKKVLQPDITQESQVALTG